MRKTLRKYVKKRLRRIVRYLKSYAIRPNHDLLHRLRLEIKKVRAVFKLLAILSRRFKYTSYYAPFKEIFKACGEIRDPHVMRTLSEKYTGEVFPPVTESPQRILAFKESVPMYVKRIRKMKKSILQESAKISTRTYRKYLKTKEQKLRKRLYPRFKQKQLHRSRKLIKDIGYLLGITRRKKKIDTFYNNAGDIIGEWHDKQILIGRIHNSDAPKPELEKELRQRAKEDLKKLRRELKEFGR